MCSVFRTCSMICLLFLLLISSARGQEPQDQSVEEQGLRVSFHVEHATPGKTAGVFHVGDHLSLGFNITDVAGGVPMSSLYPAAWINTAPENGLNVSCSKKVKSFLNGSILNRAEVDLNVYYVVSLTTDGFLTVVDPLFGFGGTRLLAMTNLGEPGSDWALSRDQRDLFVSLPGSGKVVMVDTASWTITRTLEGLPGVKRLLLQPDGHYLWAAFDGADKDSSGVVAIVAETLTEAARIPTGAGFHDLVMDPENPTLFVSNSTAGTLSVIDVATLARVEDISIGQNPVSMSYSKTARTLLLADYASGTIALIDTRNRKLVKQLKADPGLRQVAVAPKGQLALAINPLNDSLYIIDIALQKIVQTGSVRSRPSHLTFSDGLAYIMHENSDQVLMAPLGEIGFEGKPIPLADFPGGFFPSPAPDQPVLAAMTKAPAENAMILANARNATVNYYQEGMAAPMGNFDNYHHEPKGLMILDRGLLEQDDKPGFYQTVTQLSHPGRYDVAFFLDTPRIVYCFELVVLPDPNAPAAISVRARPLLKDNRIQVGEPTQIRVRLSDKQDKPLTGLTDVQMMFMMPGGLWHQRVVARDLGEGIYGGEINVPRLGFVHANVGCESLGLGFDRPNNFILKVVAKSDQPDGPENPGGQQ